ncbi:MAG: DUF421 domain-containing protein [Acutalibacteraceae bacterium]
MLKTAFRCVIMYFVTIISVRIMGKRQIGELQASELVVTIMISELASLPLQDTSQPLYHGLIAIAVLVVLEILISLASLVSPLLRKWVSGESTLIINNGNVSQKAMKKLRMTVDDLCEDLRLQGVFDISTVQYAFVETNGKISYMLFPEYRTACAGEIGSVESDDGLVGVVISDGRTISQAMDRLGLTEKDIERILKKEKVTKEQVFLLSCDKKGNYYMTKKA